MYIVHVDIVQTINVQHIVYLDTQYVWIYEPIMSKKSQILGKNMLFKGCSSHFLLN